MLAVLLIYKFIVFKLAYTMLIFLKAGIGAMKLKSGFVKKV